MAQRALCNVLERAASGAEIRGLKVINQPGRSAILVFRRAWSLDSGQEDHAGG